MYNREGSAGNGMEIVWFVLTTVKRGVDIAGSTVSKVSRWLVMVQCFLVFVIPMRCVS